MGLIKNNRKWLLKTTVSITSGVYTVLSMLALWLDFSSALSSLSPIARILFSIAILLIIALLSFIGCIIYLKNKDKFILYTTDTGHEISLQFGDILSYNKQTSREVLTSTVIPVNRCFDTIVDNRLISESSLHGKFIKSLINDNSFSPEMLNSTIQKSISGVSHIILSKQDKPLGNLKRYPAGTVVRIEADGKIFFLLGLSSFDKNLKATTSKNDYGIAIQYLIEHCDSYAQGGIVRIPIIGTGLSRVGASKNDVLQYLLHTLILNKEKLNFDLSIIVPDEDRANLLITKH